MQQTREGAGERQCSRECGRGRGCRQKELQLKLQQRYWVQAKGFVAETAAEGRGCRRKAK